MNASRSLPRWLLKFAFHLLYYQLAWTYDLVAWLVSFGQWAAWRRTATLFLKDGSTLELGYGTGGLMADMTACGLAPVGVDLSPHMACLAWRRLAAQKTIPQLVRGCAQYLPFPDASFTNVVVTFPTEFILAPQALASVARVLQPGGCLVVVAMGYLKGPRLLRDFIQWLYRITGQHEIPEPKSLDRLKASGFVAHWECATLEGATARLLVAVRC